MFKLLYLTLFLLTHIVQAAEEGQPAPACNAKLAGSDTNLDLNAYKGKVVLIDFWATWCPPCKQSMPFLNSLRNERQQDGFEVVAINVDEDSEAAKQFLQQNPVDYTMAFDPAGDCPKNFDVKAMPSSYLIDKTGTVRLVHLGFRDEDRGPLTEQVNKLLAE